MVYDTGAKVVTQSTRALPFFILDAATSNKSKHSCMMLCWRTTPSNARTLQNGPLALCVVTLNVNPFLILSPEVDSAK